MRTATVRERAARAPHGSLLHARGWDRGCAGEPLIVIPGPCGDPHQPPQPGGLG